VRFFVAGLGDFASVPPAVRPFIFQVCARQMILSATTAAETFAKAASFADSIGDADLLRSIYEVAATISRRSAKHSAEFLNAGPSVMAALNRRNPPATASGSNKAPPAGPRSVAGSSPPLNEKVVAESDAGSVVTAAIELASAFAEHAGGIAADAWACLPSALDRLDAEQSLRLMRRSMNFLERGGAAALHLLIAGG